jgi:flagellar biogenesis protein FliO
MFLEVGRMFVSLAVVLGLIWLIARVGRGRQGGVRPGGRVGTTNGVHRIELVGRRSLGRHSAVIVVRAENRTMVLGQTPQQITVLSACVDAEPGDSGQHEAAGQGGRSPEGDMPPAPRRAVPSIDGEDEMPGLASESGLMTPKAWDAFVDRLREMTVRH